MDKIEERNQLIRVFGAAARDAVDFEGPDFLLPTTGQNTLGVEVTEFYANNSDAKLKRIPDYASKLMNRTQQIHRADRDQIKVSEFVVHDKDGNFKLRATGIMQGMPNAKDRVDLLFAKISEKERKARDYLQHCHAVDLIIHDASNLFMHKKHEDFNRHFFDFAPLSDLAQTPFREIYLLTKTIDTKQIFIPLVANAFFADCFAYEYLLQPEIKANRPNGEVFQLLSACLHEEGHHRAKIFANKDGIGFLCGAWEMHYAAQGKNIRDWMLRSDIYDGLPISEALAEVPPELRKMAETLVAQREAYFAAINFWLPAENT